MHHAELTAAPGEPHVPFAAAGSYPLRAGNVAAGPPDPGDRAALRLYRSIARDNLRRREAGDANWQGLVFSLDPASYAA